MAKLKRINFGDIVRFDGVEEEKKEVKGFFEGSSRVLRGFFGGVLWGFSEGSPEVYEFLRVH